MEAHSKSIKIISMSMDKILPQSAKSRHNLLQSYFTDYMNLTVDLGITK